MGDMRIKNLPEDKLKELDSAFKKSKNTKERNRIQVIRLLAKGYSHSQVTEITELKPPTITELVGKYNKRGITALLLAKHPKNNTKLSTEQKEEIKELLSDDTKTPSSLGLGEDLRFWSTPLLKIWVRNKYNIEFKSERSYHRLFQYCGFSFHKPAKIDRKKDSNKRKEFVISAKKRLDGTVKKITLSW